MLFHTHKDNPALVRGAPDPEDQADAITVVVGDADDSSMWYALPRELWQPLFRAIRSVQECGRGHAYNHHTP